MDWAAQPTSPGWYWMNYRVRSTPKRYVSDLVFISANDTEGLMWGGLHYRREQFAEALYAGPLLPPVPPSREQAELAGGAS